MGLGPPKSTPEGLFSLRPTLPSLLNQSLLMVGMLLPPWTAPPRLNLSHKAAAARGERLFLLYSDAPILLPR